MGDLIPLRDTAAARDTLAGETNSPWLRSEPPDWDPCKGCPVRGACREVRECGAPFDDGPEPDVTLRLVEPPDIVA